MENNFKFYNTLTKKIETVIPHEDGKIAMYTCGPTVYHFAHIGNLRSYIMEDVLEKSLRYVGYDVKRVMNITDVGHLASDADTGEDKMLKGAKREHKTVMEIAKFYTDAFFEDCRKLNIKTPDVVEPATNCIPEFIKMIEGLLEKGYAYQAGGNVYFDTSKLENYYVFSTQAEAEAANLMADNGNYFRGGDMHYVDQNGDHRIDSKDRVALGSAAPDFFGGFYTQFKYKGFALGAEFSYSKGNMAYNAVRNQLEGMNTLGNQSIAVLNRWSLDGQVTDMPRVQHNDPYRSTSFSERWLEDASYLRMKSVTLSYSFDKTVLNFFRSGTLYVSGENLLTATKYLGLDPEFSYSYSETSQGLDYAKMVQPKSVKFGVNLKF